MWMCTLRKKLPISSSASAILFSVWCTEFDTSLKFRDKTDMNFHSSYSCVTSSERWAGAFSCLSINRITAFNWTEGPFCPTPALFQPHITTRLQNCHRFKPCLGARRRQLSQLPRLQSHYTKLEGCQEATLSFHLCKFFTNLSVGQHQVTICTLSVLRHQIFWGPLMIGYACI